MRYGLKVMGYPPTHNSCLRQAGITSLTNNLLTRQQILNTANLLVSFVN